MEVIAGLPATTCPGIYEKAAHQYIPTRYPELPVNPSIHKGLTGEDLPHLEKSTPVANVKQHRRPGVRAHALT